MMISRIMLSLKKAANRTQWDAWSLTEPTTNQTNLQSIRFVDLRPVQVENDASPYT